jgi:hypothetical protein
LRLASKYLLIGIAALACVMIWRGIFWDYEMPLITLPCWLASLVGMSFIGIAGGMAIEKDATNHGQSAFDEVKT